MVIRTILPDSSTSSKPAGAGFRLAGRLLTLAAAALFLSAPSLRAATATLTMQDSNFPTQVNNGGDFFNQGATELGMWANSGSKQTAGWANFGTSGFGGTARSLQIGDVFTITVSATRAFGQIGFSLNNGGTQGTSYANNISGSRMYISTDNNAAWSVKGLSGGATSSLSYVPLQDTFKDYRFTVRITSQTTADAYLTVDGTDYRAYNLALAGTAGANISALSIFGSDMWDGNSSENAYWKQTSTIQDTGRVELGYYLPSGTFTPGIVTDGLAADSTSTTVANAVFVGGDSGSAVILNQNNTYTGATTVNTNATARAQHANAFGTTAGGVTVTSGGALEMSGNIAVGAEALALNGLGISQAGALRNTSGTNSWAGGITLGSDSRINSDAGTLTISGTVGAGTNTLYVGGSGSTTISGSLSGNKTTGDGALFKNDSGTLTLSATNTGLTGLMLINGGTVSVANNGNLTSGTIQLGSGATTATLAITGGDTTRTQGITITDSSTAGVISITSGTTYMNGTLAQTGSVNTTKFGKSGAGTLYLGSANTYAGQIQIGEGDLILANNTASGTNNSTSARGIDLGLNVGDTSMGNNVGVYVLNGVTSNASIYVADNTSSATRTIGLSGSGSGGFSNEIRLDGNTTLTGGTGTATFSGNITQNSNARGLIISGGNVTLTGVNTYTGTTTINSGTLQIGNNGTTGSLASTTIVNNANLVYDLVSDGSTTVALPSGITGTGNLTVSGGRIQFGGNITQGGNMTFTQKGYSGGGTWPNSIRMTASSTLTASAITMNGLIGQDGANTYNMTLDTSASNGPINLNLSVAQSGRYYNINAFTANAGTGTLNFAGSPSLWGVGTTSLTGALNVSASFSPSTLHLNATGNSSVTGAITLGTDTVNTWTVSPGVTMNASGVLAGSNASITKNGTGRLTISGNSTYNGTTTINQGTLQLGAGGTAGTVGGNITNNAALVVDRSNNFTFGNTISGTGSLTKNGSGTLTLSVANSYSGGTTLNAGLVNIGNANALGTTGNITFGGGGLQYGSGITQDLSSRIKNSGSAILIDTNGNNVTYGSALDSTNSGGLTKNGTGTLTVSAANTYTGTTTINAGTLSLTGNSASSAHSISSGGALMGTGTAGAITLNTGGLIGAGTNSTIGTLSGASLSVGAGTGYAFTIGNVNASVAGTDYDQISLSGGLTLNNTSGSKFTIYLNGTPTGWSNSADYTWNIIKASSISGYSAAALTTDTSAFGVSPTGTFYFGTSGGNLTLSYTNNPVSTWNGGAGNWSTGFTPPLIEGWSMVFGNATAGTATNDIASATVSSVNSITFNSTAGAYTLAANSGSSGFDAATSLAVTGTIRNNSTANQTINTALTFASTRTVDAAAGNITIGGVVSGSGGLTKNGTGLLTLSGNNTYNGTTTVNAGTLSMINSTNQLARTAVAGSGDVALNGGSLTVNNSSSSSSLYLGNVTGSGNLNVTIGTYRMGGNITTTGTVSIATFGPGTDGLKLALDDKGGITRSITANAITVTGQVGDRVAPGAGTLVFDTSAANGNIYLDLANGWGGTFYTNNITANAGTGNLTLAGTNGANANGGQGWVRTNTLTGALNISTNFAAGASGGAAGTWNLTATGNSTITGNLALAASTTSTWTVNPGLTMTDSAIISGTGNLTKAGTGLLTLSANNTYNGTTTINAGTLALGAGGTAGTVGGDITNNANLLVDRSNNFTFANIISGTGNLTKNGSGTLTLSGANSYTGTTTINAGTLALGAANVIGDSSVVTMAAGGLDLGTNAETLHSLNMSGGTLTRAGAALTLNNASSITGGTVVLSSQASSRINTTGLLTLGTASMNYTSSSGSNNGNALVLGGDVAVNSSTTFDFIDSGGAAGNPEINLNNGSRVFDVGSSANLNVGWVIGSSTSSSGSLTKNGTGTLTLNATNTYSGLTTINAGTLVLGNAADTLNGAVTISGGTLSLGSNNDTVGAVTMTSGSISGTGKLTGSSYALQGGSIGANLGTGTITVTSGTTTLSGTADSTTIIINSGNLTLGAADRLADTAAVTVNSTLNLGGFNETIGAFSGNSSGVVQLGAGTLTTNASSSGTFAGGIAGTGGLAKEGSGALTLSGVNSFTGTTTINAGTLRLGAASSGDTISGNITINTGGALDYSSAVNDQIKDTSNVTIAGGTFDAGSRGETIASLSVSGGTFTKAGGTFSLSNASSFSSGSLNITSSGTLALGAASTFNGTAVTLSHAGARIGTTGTTTLGTGAFAYNNGATASTDGLVLGGDLLVQTGATANFTNGGSGAGRISLNGATRTFDVGSSANMNAAWAIVGSAGNGLTKNGTGTLTLSAANTYSGATTINAGTLVLNGSNTNSAISINSGGTLAGTGSGGGTTVNSGGRISPGGSSAGTLSTSTLTLEGGGGYTFSITNVAGTPGTEWDLLNVGSGSGSVAINATSGNKFTIYLNGSPTGWSNSGTYAWNIISSNNVTGFAADDFAFDLTAFNGGSAPTGSFYMSNSGTALVLNYSILGDAIWSGGNGSWDTGFSPGVSTNGNVFFTGATGGTATNNIPSGTLSSLDSITFNSTAGAYTLAANAGSAGASGGTALAVTGSIANNSSANQTLNLDLAFAADRVVNAASGNIAIGGVISGAGGLTKNGTGTLTLSASNTLTGAIQINNGTLATTGSGGFANSANITVASGATYSVGTSDQINSLTSPGSLTLGSGTLTISSSTASSSISGAISGSGNLTKAGSGTLTISNNNSGYSGITRLDGGVLEIGNNGALGTGNLIMGASGITIRGTDATDRTIANRFGTFAGSTAVYTFGSAATGNLTFSDTQSASLGATRTFSINNTYTRFDGIFTGTGDGITKNGTGTMILAGNNTYTGATTINAGTLQIGAGGATGNISSSSIVNNSALLVDRTGTLTLSGNMSGTGTLTKNGSGTLVLSGSNSYSGATTLNVGTLTLQASNALGTSTLTQFIGSSLLIFDTTGTIANAMSIYNAQALQSATLSGPITVNNATFDVDSGDTLTISGNIGGTGGVTKNGTGTLVLSGSNSYSSTTVVNAGTLNASNANALGTNASVTVNGGSLLVSADDAINSKNLTLASTASGNGTAASLVFSGNYNGTAGSLTLNQNSVIDLGEGSVIVHFSDIVWGGTTTLSIYNWTGTTLWGGGDGNNTDQFYIDSSLDAGELNRISFYSGIDNSSFVGTAYQLSSGSFNNEVIPVPEPETYATAVLLLLGGGACMWRTRRANKPSQNLGPSRDNARNPCHRGASHGDGEPRWSFLI